MKALPVLDNEPRMNNDTYFNSRGMSMSGHVIAYRLEEKQRFWKRILIVDDEVDVTMTFKAGIEDSNNYNDSDKRIEVYPSNNPAAGHYQNLNQISMIF